MSGLNLSDVTLSDVLELTSNLTSANSDVSLFSAFTERTKSNDASSDAKRKSVAAETDDEGYFSVNKQLSCLSEKTMEGPSSHLNPSASQSSTELKELTRNNSSLPPLTGGTPPLTGGAPPLPSETPPLKESAVSHSTSPPPPPVEQQPKRPPIQKKRTTNLASPCNFEAMNMELAVHQEDTTSLPPIHSGEVKQQSQPQKRFKRFFRTILMNRMWTQDFQSQTQRQHDEFKTESGEQMTFNLNAFRKHVRPCGKLSIRSIAILSKPSESRTDEEIKIIQKIVYRLKCFERYPLFVKQELARVLYYDQFQNGRLIIKEGHYGVSFYFIVSGSVCVEKYQRDPYTKKYYTQAINQLHAGDSFGELALLHNTKRSASIICKGTSEFLRVDKPDFNEILRNSHQREWEIKINLLSTHPVFKGCSSKELKMVNGQAKMKSYAPNMVIVSEKKQRNDRIFFIASGECSVVVRMELAKRFTSANKYKLYLPQSLSVTTKNRTLFDPNKTNRKVSVKPNFDKRSLLSVSNTWAQDADHKRPEIFKRLSMSLKEEKLRVTPDDKETHYLTIARLGGGDYFNVGESMEGMYVITVGKVEIVQVGLGAFSRNNGMKLLEEIKKKYLDSLPTLQQAFEQYSNDKRWECFKRDIVQGVAARRKRPTVVDIQDIPGQHNRQHNYYINHCDME